MATKSNYLWIISLLLTAIIQSPTSHRDMVGKSSSQTRKPMRKQEFESRWNSHLKKRKGAEEKI
ncbi:hypothetical protein OUZ56_004511 [Daphnia magna]|uniref:Uncharacterized protein n=1 Tax=Daphnia magna TaxID=35525 RepID=A0ABQ9YQ11_9CRUS|nr:hypothetical protein OUZ56_004511 [Daphnia magna]